MTTEQAPLFTKRPRTPHQKERKRLEREALAGMDSACPICERKVRVYHRKLSGQACRLLVELVRGTAVGVYEHVGAIVVDKASAASVGGEWARLRHWGFIEQRKSEPGEPDTGLWRATRLGRDFALGLTTAPSHRMFLLGRCLAEESPRAKQVNINDAMAGRFSLQELLGPGVVYKLLQDVRGSDWHTVVRDQDDGVRIMAWRRPVGAVYKAGPDRGCPRDRPQVDIDVEGNTMHSAVLALRDAVKALGDLS